MTMMTLYCTQQVKVAVIPLRRHNSPWIVFCSKHYLVVNATAKISSLYSGPALGMFEVFGRTGPPILGGRQFWHPLFSVTYLFSTSNE